MPLCLQLAVLCCPTHTPPPLSWRLVQLPCCPMHGSSLPGAPSCPARSAERLAADPTPHPGTRPRVLRSSRWPSRQGHPRLPHLCHLRCAGCICYHSQEMQDVALPLPLAVKTACYVALYSCVRRSVGLRRPFAPSAELAVYNAAALLETSQHSSESLEAAMACNWLHPLP